MAPRKRPPSTSESGTPLAFAHRSKRPTSTAQYVLAAAASTSGRSINWMRSASGSASVRPSRNGRTKLSMMSWARWLPGLGALAARPGRVSHQAAIGFDADQHGVAFEDSAFAAIERQPHRFGERVGQQEGSYTGDDHRIQHNRIAGGADLRPAHWVYMNCSQAMATAISRNDETNGMRHLRPDSLGLKRITGDFSSSFGSAISSTATAAATSAAAGSCWVGGAGAVSTAASGAFASGFGMTMTGASGSGSASGSGAGGVCAAPTGSGSRCAATGSGSTGAGGTGAAAGGGVSRCGASRTTRGAGSNSFRDPGG